MALPRLAGASSLMTGLEVGYEQYRGSYSRRVMYTPIALSVQPVEKVTFNLHDNDKNLIEFGKNKVMEVMNAACAQEVVQESRYAHLVDAARMGSDPHSSVVDKFGRTHDLSNLFVCDGSILPTQVSANPGLTIQALAARTADYLIAPGESIFTRKDRDMMQPAIRKDLAPPVTYGRGVPRLANINLTKR